METAKRTYEETEIDLMEVFQVILSRWIPIVAIGLLAAILAGVVRHFEAPIFIGNIGRGRMIRQTDHHGRIHLRRRIFFGLPES